MAAGVAPYSSSRDFLFEDATPFVKPSDVVREESCSMKNSMDPALAIAIKEGTTPRIQKTRVFDSRLALAQIEHIEEVFFSPPSAKKPLLPFCAKEFFFPYNTLRKAKIFPSRNGLPLCDALHFVVDSMRFLDRRLKVYEEKYEGEVALLKRLFARAKAMVKLPAEERREYCKKMRLVITQRLRGERGLYADRAIFQNVVLDVDWQRGFLRTSLAQRKDDGQAKVEYPDIFENIPVIIAKNEAHWKQQCDLIEGFYKGYGRLLDLHVLYVNQLIAGYRLLRGELGHIQKCDEA